MGDKNPKKMMKKKKAVDKTVVTEAAVSVTTEPAMAKKLKKKK